ncbi:MAG TPA: sugar phosphate isomerase/epimerase family protein, partial [Chloroflexota bacterium]|nr:sugar phosphate isomerase/epimerase family protein [Chloroflexota bacterium]
AVQAALAEAGLACTASGALPPGASLLDPSQRATGIAWIDSVLTVAHKCGSSLLCGPFCAPVGELPGRPRNAAEWDSAVIGLREAGRRAADRGMVLAVEILNRFETHFLNTVEDGLRLVREVDHPSVGLHLDTFHMNIEEKDLPTAFRRAAPHLFHVHFSENDRGTVGTGLVDWVGVRNTLQDVGYLGSDRWITAETFAGSVPEIAAATAIWRPIVADPWTYARDSLAFTRRLLAGDASVRAERQGG